MDELNLRSWVWRLQSGAFQAMCKDRPQIPQVTVELPGRKLAQRKFDIAYSHLTDFRLQPKVHVPLQISELLEVVRRAMCPMELLRVSSISADSVIDFSRSWMVLTSRKTILRRAPEAASPPRTSSSFCRTQYFQSACSPATFAPIGQSPLKVCLMRFASASASG